MKIDIVDGCIACGACETICPEVFTVMETSVVDTGHIFGREDACRKASEACPVSVIMIQE